MKRGSYGKEKSGNWREHRINILISLTIVIGFIISSILTYLNYGRVIEEDIKNISKLTSTSIYAEINQELVKPLFVALTMANDSFLKEWIYGESEGKSEESELQTYLAGIKEKYDYSSVFLVSEISHNYYHFQGLHKVISEQDDHDKWYFQFLKKDVSYDIEIDVDEAADNRLTAFVNCRILNDENRTLGVTGVGLKMDEIQDILCEFEETYDLEVFLINSEGLVQAHTNSALILNHNVKEDGVVQEVFKGLNTNKKTMQIFRYNEDSIDGYLITHYIDDLDWYLIVKKDTSVLRKSFFMQLLTEFAVAMLVILGVLLLSNSIIKQNHKEISKLMKTDQLTKLLNRRGFDLAASELMKENYAQSEKFSIFLFDIDDFKLINDKHGHLFGDNVIVQLADTAKSIFADNGILARWGGDEFAGIVYGDVAIAEKCLKKLIKTINSTQMFKEHNITISAGLASKNTFETVGIVIARADRALYKSKGNGKNQLTIL